MASIMSFKAVRPAKSKEALVASLPYDVYSEKEAREYVKDKPYSFLNIDLPQILFSEGCDLTDKNIFSAAGKYYKDLKEKGVFVQDEDSCLYLYEQTMDGRTQLGLVCCASMYDYENGVIKRHENTREDKERERVSHIYELSAHTGPVFLAYKDREELNKLFETITQRECIFDFVSDNNVRQRGWKIDSPNEIEFIVKEFESVPTLYISDGHHRCAAAGKVSKMLRTPENEFELYNDHNFALSVLFPASELMIMDYNRVLADLNGYTEEGFLNEVRKTFEVSKIYASDDKPSCKGDIYMFIGDDEYLLRIKDEFVSKDPVKSLDVSVLQDNLLGPILGIDDPRTNKRIDFVGGIRGVKELRNRLKTGSCVAFAMYPTQMSELFAVADAGLLMPPKSTWFEPKLLSGLFIHEFN